MTSFRDEIRDGISSERATCTAVRETDPKYKVSDKVLSAGQPQTVAREANLNATCSAQKGTRAIFRMAGRALR
jgi:hypothetical protein